MDIFGQIIIAPMIQLMMMGMVIKGITGAEMRASSSLVLRLSCDDDDDGLSKSRPGLLDGGNDEANPQKRGQKNMRSINLQ